MPNRFLPWGVLMASFLLPAALGAGAPPPDDALTPLLRRQTQEMFDAVTAGDSTVWERYLAPDVAYADEEGLLNDRAQLLAGIKPLPANISGRLELHDFVVHRHGDTAVTTFVVDEAETYFGQQLHARYLTTNTWQQAGPAWQLIAGQSLALRDDPPAVRLPPGRLDEYVGVYRLTPEVTCTIRRAGDGLTAQRTGRPAQTLQAELPDLFFIPGQKRLRRLFQRDPGGRITGFVERRESWDVVWTRVP